MYYNRLRRRLQRKPQTARPIFDALQNPSRLQEICNVYQASGTKLCTYRKTSEELQTIIIIKNKSTRNAYQHRHPHCRAVKHSCACERYYTTSRRKCQHRKQQEFAANGSTSPAASGTLPASGEGKGVLLFIETRIQIRSFLGFPEGKTAVTRQHD